MSEPFASAKVNETDKWSELTKSSPLGLLLLLLLPLLRFGRATRQHNARAN